MATWEFIVSGCGTSHGNPPWGRPELWSTDPRDARRRSGGILRGPHGQLILLDCGPDLLHQLRDPYKRWDGLSYPQECIVRCDGVFLTHTHADHSHGLNELRHLNRLMGGTAINIYGHEPHLRELRQMFTYCFREPDKAYHMGSPALQTVALRDLEPYTIAGLPVRCVGVSHGSAGRTSAFRLGNLAYVTDVKEIPPEAESVLAEAELLAINMLREEPHPTHCCWAETCDFIRRLRPQRVVLIHMGHEVRYAQWQKRLLPNMAMAYDGWSSMFSAE